jgi:hypothetical protein
MALSDLAYSQVRRLPRRAVNQDDAAEIRPVRSYRPISADLANASAVSVIIPARNEAANLPRVFGTLLAWAVKVGLKIHEVPSRERRRISGANATGRG